MRLIFSSEESPDTEEVFTSTAEFFSISLVVKLLDCTVPFSYVMHVLSLLFVSLVLTFLSVIVVKRKEQGLRRGRGLRLSPLNFF